MITDMVFKRMPWICYIYVISVICLYSVSLPMSVIDLENKLCMEYNINLSSLLIWVMNNASVLGLVEFMLELRSNWLKTECFYMFCINVLLKDGFLKMFKTYNIYCKSRILSVLAGIVDKEACCHKSLSCLLCQILT